MYNGCCPGYNGCCPGYKVSILCVGDIGHMCVIFAKVQGAEVTIIFRTSVKKDDVAKLGADKFIATKKETNWA